MLTGTIVNLTLFTSILPIILDPKNPTILAVLALIEFWVVIWLVISLISIFKFFFGKMKSHAKFKFRFYKTEMVSTLNILALIFAVSTFVSMVLNICNPFQFMAFAVVILLARLLADIYMSPSAPPEK